MEDFVSNSHIKKIGILFFKKLNSDPNSPSSIDMISYYEDDINEYDSNYILAGARIIFTEILKRKFSYESEVFFYLTSGKFFC